MRLSGGSKLLLPKLKNSSDMGKIAIEGMRFYAFHGLLKEEQIIGGNYIVDVYLDASIEKASENDDIKSTIDY
jgi:7,8-dihydroneopterin aldolase/epimerase/oxygenase